MSSRSRSGVTSSSTKLRPLSASQCGRKRSGAAARRRLATRSRRAPTARVANRRLAAAPLRFLPHWLADRGRSFVLEDVTPLLDRLLMHKLPAEIAALRRAAQMADDAYAVFRDAIKPGRRQ